MGGQPIGYAETVRFTDLHCHLLPGVDDGPRTMAETVAYAAAAAAAGTRTVVATPHVEMVDVRELPDRVRAVRAALAAEGIALDVRCGGELKWSSLADLGDDELELIAHGPRGARWVLYETPFAGPGEEFVAGARELRDRGFGVLLAHPERSRGILDAGLRAIEALVREGALIAANVGPLVGLEGPERLRAAEHLLRRGLPAVVATDAHAPDRPYTLKMPAAAIERVTRRADLARRLTGDVPARLLTEGIAAARRAA